jgi:2-hydroxychromene-2-carboxylate isomerase
MPITKQYNLTSEDRLDVRHAMTVAGLPSDPAAEGYETEEQYLDRLAQTGDVGDHLLRSYHEARVEANHKDGIDLADALLAQGIPMSQAKELFAAAALKGLTPAQVFGAAAAFVEAH